MVGKAGLDDCKVAAAVFRVVGEMGRKGSEEGLKGEEEETDDNGSHKNEQGQKRKDDE